MKTHLRMLQLFCLILVMVGLCAPVHLHAQVAAPGNHAENRTVTPVNEVPPEPVGSGKYVVDLAGLLTPEDAETLRSRLAQADAQGEVQIAVVILPATDRDLSEFSPVIMNRWGIGHAEKDDGVLILANAQRIRAHASGNRIFIGTGLGTEGALPDAVAGRILDESAIPAFDRGDYSGGIREATLAVVYRLSPEGRQAQEPQPSEGEGSGMSLIILILILFIVFSMFNRPRRGRYWGGGFGGGGFGGGGFGGGGGGFGGGRSGGGGAGR